MNYDPWDDRIRVKEYVNQDVAYVSPKADGHYHTVVAHRGSVQVFSRRKGVDKTEAFSKLPFWSELIRAVPRDTVLVGELHCPGTQATSVPTLLNRADPDLLLTPFATPWFNGNDFRRVCLHEAMTAIRAIGLKPAEYRELTDDDTTEALLAEAVKNKMEGWVLKLDHWEGWYKLKPTRTVDCVVMDQTRSESPTFYGDLMGIQCGVFVDGKLTEIASTGNGFSAEEKKELGRLDLKGRVCELEFDSLAAKGKLKFPRFVRWRPEKETVECDDKQLQSE